MQQTKNSRTTTNLSVRWMLKIVFLVSVVRLAARASSTKPAPTSTQPSYGILLLLFYSREKYNKPKSFASLAPLIHRSLALTHSFLQEAWCWLWLYLLIEHGNRKKVFNRFGSRRFNAYFGVSNIHFAFLAHTYILWLRWRAATH
jgi:hypothetical protein